MKYIVYLFFVSLPCFACSESFEHKTIVASAAKVIEEQYYDADIGKQISANIKHGQFGAQFLSITDKQEFAETISKELRRISGDNHIGIVYSPDDVKRYQIREQARVDVDAKRKDHSNYEARLAESKMANFGIQQLRLLEGEVGYIEIGYFDGFVKEAAPVFEAAMDFLASSKVIILDLRRNGGGNSRILPLFLGYFLGPTPVHFADRIERWKNEQSKLFSDANVGGTRHFNKPIYILTSGTTFSLAEHVTYHLKAFGRATVVGERTYGGGKAFDPVVLNDDFYLRLPRIEMINTVTHSMYQEGIGIAPDIATSAQSAFDVAYMAALELLESSSSDEKLKQYYRWVHRVAAIRGNQESLKLELPMLLGQRSFDEFVFETRRQELWMSFRELPWVKLINLGDGYFYDDRSIQRQFLFKEHNGQLELHVFRLWHQPKVIIEN